MIEHLRHALSRLRPGPPHPCGYLSDQPAREAAFSVSRLPPGVYHALMDLNFRRSGCTLYRPACDGCAQCVAIRVPVQSFRPNRSQRRCLQRNSDVECRLSLPVPTRHKHALYARYLAARHQGQMSGAWEDFVDFLYQSPVQTLEMSYWTSGILVGAGLVDVEPRALSTVYFYYAPEEQRRGLGTFNILRTIEQARCRGIPWVYLGYHVRDSAKMNYKSQFRPCEILSPNGAWRPYVE